MCQKCAKRLKNRGGRTKVPKGLLKHLTREFAKGHAIPFFADMNSNLFVEARLYTNQKRATKKVYERNPNRRAAE